jgi:hypothetical protein
MGQYYYPIILDAVGKIVVWMNAQMYNNGIKLTEHSFLNNSFVNTFEFGLSPEGIYHKSRVVWAGDYADPEAGKDTNLYAMCDEYNLIRPEPKNTLKYRYIVNHSKKLYVDKTKIPCPSGCSTIHPLPLLTVEGNGRGGGDYHTDSTLVGSWARDIISVEMTISDTFQEIVFDLTENI